ncbi:MAG: transcriptional coactivator p15/PC4 family protein [Deltaproteobacteria bacterium]|nr:transcriptional coactivator p15/PC4 family protein [Deltaproteobacteria bacterium]
MSEKPVCEIPKNAREKIIFRLGEFKGHKFCDMRVFITEPGEDSGKEPSPTKKGLAVSPTLWPQFKEALGQVEAAMIKEGWLDREDLEPEV